MLPPRWLRQMLPSSKNPQAASLVVFTSKMAQGRHSLKVFNRAAGKLQQLLP
jgi:hypothetical protein